ncbi:MAG: arylesterase [Pseudomonadales bacterium]
MRKLLLTIVVLLLPSLSLQAVASADHQIVVLGDSLSAGYGIDSDFGWVSLLSQHLQQKNPSITVTNASISGETTIGGLSRLPDLLARNSPSIIIIELGANDGLRGYPLTNLNTNLSRIVELSQSANAKVLLVGMHIPPNYGRRYTSRFYQTFTDVAEKYKTAIIPFLLEGIATQTELMQADGLHPTAEAQTLILANVLPELEKLLTR